MRVPSNYIIYTANDTSCTYDTKCCDIHSVGRGQLVHVESVGVGRVYCLHVAAGARASVSRDSSLKLPGRLQLLLRSGARACGALVLHVCVCVSDSSVGFKFYGPRSADRLLMLAGGRVRGAIWHLQIWSEHWSWRGECACARRTGFQISWL